MDERILFKNSNGGLSVMTPTGVLSVKETALQDVPTGVKFKIINFSELPSDITFRMLGSTTLQTVMTELVNEHYD